MFHLILQQKCLAVACSDAGLVSNSESPKSILSFVSASEVGGGGVFQSRPGEDDVH